jgi:hypothetical protein
MSDPFVEVRGEVLSEHVAIMDAVAQAIPGASRTSIMRQIIAEWVAHELHRSTLVQRVANANGTVPDMNRNRNGNGGRK